MTADHDPDPGRQRTVAELLQQYGGGRGSESRRRRRDNDDDDRVPERGSAEGGAPAVEAASAPPAPEQWWPTGSAPGQLIDPLTGDPLGSMDSMGSRGPVDPLDPLGSTGSGGPVGSTGSFDPLGSTGSRRPIDPLDPLGSTEPSSYRSRPIGRAEDPPTERLPRYPEAARGGVWRGHDPASMTGPITGPMTGPITGQVSREELFGDDDTDGPPSRASRGGSAAPAGLAERDERGELAEQDEPAAEQRRRLGFKGWVGLIIQWLLGAVIGALLWVGFSYLWMHYAVFALVAAVLTTASLVVLVRTLRRNDDLQTTMLAVFVGLVVTISPAVLLLTH